MGMSLEYLLLTQVVVGSILSALLLFVSFLITFSFRYLSSAHIIIKLSLYSIGISWFPMSLYTTEYIIKVYTRDEKSNTQREQIKIGRSDDASLIFGFV